MAGPASSFADSWEQTGSLVALRAVIEKGSRLRHLIARRAGLAENHLVAMEHLMREPLGPAELARILDVSTAASSGIVDRLVDHGHVRRRPHEQDRRRTQVEVTDSGREDVLAQLLPMFRSLDELDRSFTTEERAVVERYLRGVLGAFDDLERQPPPSDA
jgi:DNA-binding MarR family transcriptional regulator